MNVGSMYPIAWNNSRHAPLWQFHFHCGIEKTSVAGKFIPHHHCHSAWQRAKLQQGYRDTGMMEMDWAMEGVCKYQGSGDE
jgi:hypothetical protein